MQITHSHMSKEFKTGFTRISDDDGVGLFTLEWVWSDKHQQAFVWHHYTYDRNPELYTKAKQAVKDLNYWTI